MAAQILLLQKCRSCITRLLRDHESSLLAAKVLSISRLLLKTLSQASSPLPVLETIRIQLASLRRHLLRRLNQRLSNLDSSQEQLVEAICAFCLATSSSSSDALRHYQHLRLQEIRRALQVGEIGHQNTVHALRYYIKSLQTTKVLLGRSLSEALHKLGAQSILRDPGVRRLDELDLGTLQRWVAVEIQEFVPFIKHTDLKESEVDSTTHGWSRDAFDIFIAALKHKVESTESTLHLLSLRRSLLETWLPVCISTPVHSSSNILNVLRDVLNKRMCDLMREEAESLAEIGTAIENTTGGATGERGANLSIWEETFVTMATGKGASTWKQQLRMRHLGIMESTSNILRSLDTWIAEFRATREVLQQLRKDRWQDLVEDDEEDDEAADRIESILQCDDSKLYELEQVSSVVQALTDFQLKIKDMANKMAAEKGCEQAKSLLRIIRETVLRLRQAFPEADLTTLDTIPLLLHNRLATDVAIKLLASSESTFASQRLSVKASSHLWEGVPPLPVQPSPRIFKLLYKMNEIMAELGADLWTQAAVGAAKKAASECLVEHNFFDSDPGNPHGKDVNELTNGTTMVNGDTPKRPVSAHHSRIQHLFDALYLNCALAQKQGEDVMQLAGRVEILRALSDVKDSDAKVLSRRAKDFWARTNLLFGLLA